MSAVEYPSRRRGTRGIAPLTTQTQIFVKRVPGTRSLLILVDLDDQIISIENKIRRSQNMPKFDFRLSRHGQRLDEFDTPRGIGLKALSTLICNPFMVRNPPSIVPGDCILNTKDGVRLIHNSNERGMHEQL